MPDLVARRQRRFRRPGEGPGAAEHRADVELFVVRERHRDLGAGRHPEVELDRVQQVVIVQARGALDVDQGEVAGAAAGQPAVTHRQAFDRGPGAPASGLAGACRGVEAPAATRRRAGLGGAAFDRRLGEEVHQANRRGAFRRWLGTSNEGGKGQNDERSKMHGRPPVEQVGRIGRT